MKEGRITKIIKEKRFFFIDEDYWCHFNNYDREPELTHIVEYEPSSKPDGKKFANNVQFIRKELTPFEKYLDDLNQNGYFGDNEVIRKEFLIDYPQLLANIFAKDGNKVNQLRKYFDFVRVNEGKFKIYKNFALVQKELYELSSLVNYAKNKENISKSLADFFDANIEQAVKSEKHCFDGFIPHFQAVIGYFK